MDAFFEEKHNEQTAPFDTDEVDNCREELSTSEERGVCENMEKGQPVVLSKRKQKRLAKHKLWLERKEEKKIAKKEKKRKAKEQGFPFPSRSARRKNQKTMDCDEALSLKIVIDMAFDEFMNESSIKKLLKQVKWCYSANRKAKNPVQLYLSSFGGQNKTIMDEVYHEHKNWDIHIKTEPYSELFDKSDVVYLSSDSDNVLEDIDMSKVYIIGGLVDHNHHKGLCHKFAVENKVNHAQLPINDFVKLQSRTVLTVNHVFEILLKFLETKDWQTAFYDVIPKRKGVELLTKGPGESDVVPDEQLGEEIEEKEERKNETAEGI